MSKLFGGNRERERERVKHARQFFGCNLKFPHEALLTVLFVYHE